MMISHRRRFIFVHIYRTAGQSISEALAPYSDDPDRLIVHIPVLRRLLKRRIVTHRKLMSHNAGHPSAKELKAALPPKVFDNFHKFTFVRNPWDWQISVYHFVVQYPSHPYHEFYKSFGRFENYLEWRIKNGVQLQKEFVVSETGESLVDFVGRYETLQKDFETVCKRVGIKCRLGIKCSLPHRNQSTHNDYREYYTPQTKALVARAYEEDIDFFGYEFDTPPGPA